MSNFFQLPLLWSIATFSIVAVFFAFGVYAGD
jgi:hypothetical protein